MFEKLDGVNSLIRIDHSMRELGYIFVAEELQNNCYELPYRKFLCHSTHCVTGVFAPNFLVNKI